MSQETVKITVDGKELEANSGQMLIEVTDAADIYIPRFCYHRKLSIAANCRMCLVQVEKAPKPLPACATPVASGMVVHTRNKYAIEAQKATMEFLLINHPLDCPICDQGGECELQDIAMGYGRDISRYNEGKRVVADENLGPLISTDMTRCIHCTRCVRFGQEIAGIQELGTIGRGDRMEISTYIEHSVDHELSGNIIDLCPVGALNNKPYRFSARAWEMEQRATVAPHDCLGTNIHAHVLRGRLKRVVPRDNDAINETWLSDRDRFSYEGIYSEDRLQQPLVRRDGQLHETSWEEALQVVAEGLQGLADSHGGDVLGAWISNSATVEEAYLASRFMRHLGSDNIDHRLRRRDFRGQSSEALLPGLGMPIADVDSLKGLLVIGSNLRKEVPLLAHRVRKAAMAGAKVSFLNTDSYPVLFPVAEELVSDAAGFVDELHGLIAAAEKAGTGSPAQQAIVQSLSTDNCAIFLGHVAARHPAWAELWQLAGRLAHLTGAHLGQITEGSNAAGVSYAGALPHRGAAGAVRSQPGYDFSQMLVSPLRGLMLLGVEPEFDCTDQVGAMNTVASADFVVALTPWLTASAESHADVILPIGTFAETSGTYVNAAGEWQSFTGVAQPVGAARPAWKVLRVLGNLVSAPDFEYQTTEGVRDELLALTRHEVSGNAPKLETADGVKVQATELHVPLYAIDGLVRRASSLQRTRDAVPDWRRLA